MLILFQPSAKTDNFSNSAFPTALRANENIYFLQPNIGLFHWPDIIYNQSLHNTTIINLKKSSGSKFLISILIQIYQYFLLELLFLTIILRNLMMTLLSIHDKHQIVTVLCYYHIAHNRQKALISPSPNLS